MKTKQTVKKVIRRSSYVGSKIAELGKVTILTQGLQRGWFEYGRPGNDRRRRPF